MPWEGAAAMDEAAAKAGAMLETAMREMDPKEAQGVRWLQTWWRDNYGTAGHKRLGRILRDLDDA